MKKIKKLKIKRELILIKNHFLKNVNNPATEKTYAILLKSGNFIIKYYKHLNDITITQYSRFGFIITYEIYSNNKLIMKLDENELHNKYNRKSMNILILSKLNKSRHKINKINTVIKKISEIDY